MNQLCNSNSVSCLLLSEKNKHSDLKKKVKRALTQSQRVVCELRNAGKDHGELQRAVIRLFEGGPKHSKNCHDNEIIEGGMGEKIMDYNGYAWGGG